MKPKGEYNGYRLWKIKKWLHEYQILSIRKRTFKKASQNNEEENNTQTTDDTPPSTENSNTNLENN